MNLTDRPLSNVERFNETAQFVRIVKKTDGYEVIGIDGRMLFYSSLSRRALHFAEGCEGDYAEMVS